MEHSCIYRVANWIRQSLAVIIELLILANKVQVTAQLASLESKLALAMQLFFKRETSQELKVKIKFWLDQSNSCKICKPKAIIKTATQVISIIYVAGHSEFKDVILFIAGYPTLRKNRNDGRLSECDAVMTMKMRDPFQRYCCMCCYICDHEIRIVFSDNHNNEMLACDTTHNPFHTSILINCHCVINCLPRQQFTQAELPEVKQINHALHLKMNVEMNTDYMQARYHFSEIFSICIKHKADFVCQEEKENRCAELIDENSVDATQEQ